MSKRQRRAERPLRRPTAPRSGPFKTPALRHCCPPADAGCRTGRLGRTARHPGRRSRRIVWEWLQEHFDRGKNIGRIRRTAFREAGRLDQHFKPTLPASEQVRLARMPIAVPAGAAP